MEASIIYIALSRTRPSLLAALTSAAFLSVCSHAQAGTASADMRTGKELTAVFIQGSTSTLYAYSQVIQPSPVGPNASSSYGFNGAFTFPAAAVPGQSIVVKSGIINQNKTFYSPVVGVTNAGKPPIPAGQTDGTQSVSSNSRLGGGGASGFAFYHANSGIVPDSVQATGTLTPPTTGFLVGAAAASAVDPALIPPGSYPYPILIDADFQMDDSNESGGVNVFALDSRFTDLDTFYERGEPLDQSLWAMVIYTSGIPHNKSDITLAFYVNPAARSLGILNPALSNQQIADNAIDALSVNDGVVELDNFSPFAAGTMFAVRGQDGTIEYGAGVDAGIQQVPEPSALVLLLAGLLLLCWRERGVHGAGPSAREPRPQRVALARIHSFKVCYWGM